MIVKFELPVATSFARVRAGVRASDEAKSRLLGLSGPAARLAA